jgi:hypothetical protein
MPRRRWIVATAVLVALLVAVEIGVRQWARPKACVQIINEGQEAIEGLVVIYGDTRMPVGRIPQGQSVQVRMTAGPPGPLRLEYRQKGNALQGFQIADYDPAQNVKDAFKQVVAIGTNQIQKYMEDDETRKEDETLGERIIRWLQSDDDAPK